MPVRAQCPSCSAVANLPDSVQGKAVKLTCKKCGTAFHLKPAKSGGKAAPSSAKAKPAPAKTKPVPAKRDLAFEDGPVAARPGKSAKPRGRGVNWLLIGGLGGGAVVALGVVLFLFMRTPPDANKKIAEAKEQTPKEKQPSVPPDNSKKKTPEEETKPAEKKIDAIPNPVNEKPEPKTPKIEHAAKTPDGAMTLTAHPDKHLRFAAISPDGKTIYSAAWDNQLRIWDAEAFALKAELPLPKPDQQQNSRLQATLSADGKRLAFAHWDILQIMDLETKKVEAFDGMPNEEHGLGQIVLSADGSTVLTNWGIVHYALWKAPERKFVAKLQYDGMGLASGESALMPDGGAWFHAPSNVNGVRLIALPDCRELGNYFGPEPVDGVDAVSYHTFAPTVSPKGKLLAYAQSGKGKHSVRVFDLAKKAMLYEMPLTKFSKEPLDARVSSIAIAPDDKLLVLLDSYRWLHGYNLESGTFLGALPFPPPNPYGGDDQHTVQFTNDGRRVIAAACNVVKIWERDSMVWPK